MQYKTKQKGAVLLVSLILLLVLTSAGVSAISTALLEERLSSNHHDRHIAFQSAESALIAAESLLLQKPFESLHWSKNCQGNRCFTPSCQNGLCLNAIYNSDESCIPGNEQPWTKAQIWQDARYYRRLQPFQGSPKTTRYIVEFRCFLDEPPPPQQPPVEQNTNSEKAPKTALYRITVLATGMTDSARVMLQSTIQQPAAITSEKNETTQGKQPTADTMTTQQLFRLRAQQRRSWQQMEITF